MLPFKDMEAEVFAKGGFFSMLALDHRGSFKQMMKPGAPDTVTAQELIRAKKDIITALAGIPSGILVDMEYGLAALKEAGVSTPYLLALEKTGYEEVGEDR